jgi:hypothetical protein
MCCIVGHRNPSSLDGYDNTVEISREVAMRSMVPTTHRNPNEGPLNLVNYFALKNQVASEYMEYHVFECLLNKCLCLGLSY